MCLPSQGNHAGLPLPLPQSIAKRPCNCVPALREIGQRAGEGFCELLAVDVGIDGDGFAGAVLDSLTDRREDADQCGIDPWALYAQRRIIDGECDRGS